MMLDNSFVLGFLIAFLSTLFLIPIVIRFAKKNGIYDFPSNIKEHKKPVPYLGGLAIFFGFFVSILSLFYVINISFIDASLFIILISASTCLVILGYYDDINDISPFKKLFFELFIVSFVLFYLFYLFDSFRAYVFFIFAFVWIIYIMNAFNNIDGLDGLAAGVTIISLFFFLLNFGHIFFVGFVALILIGSCFGFLTFNFPPARIFMGDAGSLFLGFILAFIPLIVFIKDPSFLVIEKSFFILGFIIFDTLFVIVFRVYSGKSIFGGDLNHSYNFLRRILGDDWLTILLVYLTCFIFGCLSFII